MNKDTSEEKKLNQPHVESSESTESKAVTDDDVQESPQTDGVPDQQNSTYTVQAPAEAPKKHSFNKYFLYTLVAGLILSALISVTAVLVGEFNSTMQKALGTTASMVCHTIIALVLVSIAASSKSRTGKVLLNTMLLITIASFITSLFGIWEVISGQIIWDLYLLYIYTFFASLWIQLLLKMGENFTDKPTRYTTYIAIGFTVLFYILLIPTIFTHYPDKLPEFHYRAMAATIIVLATTSVLATVFHRIYIFKHPEAKSLPSAKSGIDVVIAAIVFVLGLPIIFGLISIISSYNMQSYDDSYRARQYSSTQTTSDDKSFSLIDCSQLPPIDNQVIVQYDSTHIFESLDTTRKQLNLSDYSSNARLAPIVYTEPLKIVDNSCLSLATNSLEQGDTVQIYLKDNYTNFYTDSVAIVQKLD